MIIIDTDLTTLMQKLNISTAKMQQQYSMMSVEEIVEAEAAQGNQQAVEYARELFTNPEQLVKIFKLADPNNKLEILSEMTAQQLALFLPEMEETDLSEGLKYFTQDKLLSMLESIPPEQLVNTVFEMFSQEEIIQYLPEEQLDKFLSSTEMDKNKIMEHMKEIPPELIAQMLETMTGQPVEDMSMESMLETVGGFNPLEFKNALLSLQPVAKQQLTLGLAKEDTKLFQLFDARAYTNMINTYKQQPELVKAMNVIEEDQKIKMLKELPNDLLSIVITQMDAQDFADILIKRCPELLAEIIAR
ncbi:MAG: hypothetical protein MRZ62_03385 [Brachyspira sp.]|nr:hypothetical protein [Brachyspira sp.]